MISAFDVYLVMQLNNLIGVAVAVAIISALGLFACCMTFGLGNDTIARKNAKRFAIAGATALTILTVTPSSKTAAAMIVLPALTSEQVMQPVSAEAAEIYALAKKALAKVADEPTKQESK